MSRLVLPSFFLMLGSTGGGCGGDDGSSPEPLEPSDVSTTVDPDPDPDPPLDPSTSYIDRGQHPVGYTVLAQPQPSADDLVVKAWYPADDATEGAEEIDYQVVIQFAGFPAYPVPFTGRAHLDAEPDAGPFPLVVLSHGFSLNPEWYHPLAEHLASHGFVVFGPEHLESDWFTDVVPATVSRPAAVSATIDLASEGSLSSVIDVDQVAVVGHSYGGYTALAVAGARFDPQDLAQRCIGVTDPLVMGLFCGVFTSSEAVLADLMGLDEVPTGLWPSLADDRVDAIVPMAGDAYLFGEAGLASVEVPALVLGGTADTGTPWDWGAGLAFESVSSDPRMLVSLEGAEHFIPVTSCDNMPWTAALTPEYLGLFCEDPAWDKQEALDIIHHLTTAFLLQTLRDDEDAAAALDPSLYEDIDALGVTWISQDR